MADPHNLRVFVRKVRIVLQGTLAAQAIGLLLLPVLTNVYSTAEFGVYQAALSPVSALLVISALRYEIPVLTAANRSQAKATATV